MEIIEIKEENKLNDFLAGQKYSQFLQSFPWGSFQERVAGKVFRLGVEESGNLVAAATIVKKVLPMGKNYFYCPRGPIVNSQLSISNYQLALDLLFKEVEEIARKEGVMFMRLEPQLKIENCKLIIEQTLDVQPSKTLVLNLDKSEEELLSQMHQKTRYNIRLAEKKKIKVVETGIESFDKFWQLMGETSDRDSFRLHGIDYYKEMLKVGGDFIKLFFAQHKGKDISAGIFSFFGNTTTYMHGASSDKDRNLMAPYALQWHAIKMAKKMGYKYYDFFGIDEKKWPGVTRFKNGFGGKEINYPGTFDLIFNSGWYSVYKMVRKVRRTF
ncbi:MAG: peptidoglycan bridge formation glycyltransferase FemA/FemB family protein [Patescibacteria group bacterium]|nr:peptidoglycan bridge formation glycyltransferase FemA/FemB family protein [Patescibacteria group bacterium]